MRRPFLFALVLIAACSSVPERPALRARELAAGGPVRPTPAQERELEDLDSALAAGRTARVAAGAQALLVARPGLARARALLGRALARDPASSDEAEAQLLAARELGSDDHAVDRSLGVLYETQGHLDAALAAFERALTRAAFDAESLLGAARCATELGKERRARRHLEALRALPTAPAGLLDLEARCYLVLAEARDQDKAAREVYVSRARRAFEEMRRQEPDEATGVSGVAYCLFLRAQQRGVALSADRAREISDLFLEAARLAPTDPLPRYNLARFLESPLVGSEAAAITAYRATLDREPLHLPSLLNLARLLARDGKVAEARRLYERALPHLVDPRDVRRVRAFLAREETRNSPREQS